MMNQSSKLVALALAVIGLCGLPACSLPGNGNGNDNGNDNVDTDFAIFVDPDSDFETNDIRDIDGETIKIRISNQSIVYQDGREFQEGSWTADGNFLANGAFQVRFGTQDEVRQAYFTETGPATICDFNVTDTSFSIAPTEFTVPQ